MTVDEIMEHVTFKRNDVLIAGTKIGTAFVEDEPNLPDRRRWCVTVYGPNGGCAQRTGALTKKEGLASCLRMSRDAHDYAKHLLSSVDV